MILAVCLNLALDLTYRVAGVASRAGGKAVNAARVLDALGHEVVVTGFSGGWVATRSAKSCGRPGSRTRRSRSPARRAGR